MTGDRTASARQRRHRRLKRQGRMSLRITVDDVAYPQKLISLGLLKLEEEDDPRAIEKATTEMLDRMAVGDQK